MKKRVAGLIVVSLIGTVIASSAAHSEEVVRFDSAHIRFVEITYQAGEKIDLPARLIPAVLVVDGPLPEFDGGSLKNRAGADNYHGNRATPPKNAQYPWCQIEAARPARFFTVASKVPIHYYRIEYKRIDGDEYAQNWRIWYPWIMSPVKTVKDPGRGAQPGPAYSAGYPYSKAYDPTVAAPANHLVRYEDEHVQLVEVVVRPGETENFHGHPYSSVFADDGGGFYPSIKLHNEVVNPRSVNPRGQIGLPPEHAKYPTCFAAIPEWPHAVTVTGNVPQHFYRLHFKTIDADRK